MSTQKPIVFNEKDRAVVAALAARPEGLTLAELREVTGMELVAGNVSSMMKKQLIAAIGERTVEKEVESNESIEIPEEKEVIVYWTPNGKSYHMKNTCRTLARSKVILSGNTLECEKAICCEHCKIEEDKNKI